MKRIPAHMYIMSMYVFPFVSVNQLQTSHVAIKIDIQKLKEKAARSNKK